MKVQEYTLLIFAAISFWAEQIAADFNLNQGYYDAPLDWPTATDISGSSSTGYDKSSLEDSDDEDSSSNIYKYTVKKPNGQDVCLSEYAGKVLVIVNYASACGFTYDNLCALSELAKKYRECGLEILLFPSNDFLQIRIHRYDDFGLYNDCQPLVTYKPGLNVGGDFAAEVLANNYPEFEVFSEICVNGRTQHPMYRFLKNKLPGAFNSKTIKWNFTKFIVDRKGCAIKRYATTDSFKDIEELVQELLKDQCC